MKEVSARLQMLPFVEAVRDITGGNRKFSTSEYLPEGDTPIVDQSENFISGFTNDKNIVKREKPVVVFGDHTTVLKFIDFYFCLGADGVKVLQPIDGIDTKYLYYYLLKQELPNVGYSRHFKFLKEISVPLSSLPTQKRIAEILDKADALRKKDRQLLKHYDDLAQSLFIDMFGDPVRNEKSWEVKKIGTISTSKLGKMLDSKKNTGEHVYEYLGNSNVLWHKFDFNDLKKMAFTDKEKVKYKLESGDILMCEGGEAGRCAVWKNERQNLFFQKAIHQIRLNTQIIIPDFFSWLIYFLVKGHGLKNYITTATIAHLTGIKLKEIPIIVPPIPLQNQFAEQIQNIEQQKEKLKAQIVQSENLFQSLVQQAFNGGLD